MFDKHNTPAFSFPEIAIFVYPLSQNQEKKNENRWLLSSFYMIII